MKQDKAKGEKGVGYKYSFRDFSGRSSQLFLEGNRRATLEGSKGVLEYSDVCIRVAVDNSVLSFSGRGLGLKCISPTALVVEGYILDINFSE